MNHRGHDRRSREERGARALTPHSESPRLDAELLLASCLGLPRSALIARGNEPVAPNDENAYAR